MREIPVIVQVDPHWIFLEFLLKRRRVDGIHVNSVEEESGHAFVLIETHVLHHLMHGGEDAQTGIAVGGCISTSCIALIRIQIIVTVGCSRVPKAVAAVSKVQYTACVHLKVTFQMLFYLKQRFLL